MKEIKRKFRVTDFDVMVNDYNYSKDVSNWEKDNPDIIYKNRAELPKWMKQ